MPTLTCMFFGPFDSSFGSRLRWRAKDAALLTRPSISAPLKFLVSVARSFRFTSVISMSCSRILDVCILRIWRRPCSSGRPISTCTSRRPGRSSASSIRSLRFVIPMTRMLFSESTPSILLSSWLTTVSCTPVPSRLEPRCLQIASISSKMMMCRCAASPLALASASASANSFRMFSSDAPTYLFKISGPLTILGSTELEMSLPILRAMRVLPVPGGPCSSIPLT
mmetsp:Transcript_13626/g.23340  ORF Transcript_13626/g.23340 Transcript_13626/m.23340 type:complete len:225 (-) Transcript_13626:957-1631(-)